MLFGLVKKRLPRCPIIHSDKVPQYLEGMIRSGRLRKAFSDRDDLTIVTAHNYPQKTVFERSLDFLGIKNYVVLQEEIEKWHNTAKIIWLRDFLASGRCRTEYLLCCDATDVILQGGPDEIMEIFFRFGCDLLFCSTRFTGGYACMPQVKEWADSIFPGRYLNSRVYIGKSEFILETMNVANEYISEETLTNEELKALVSAKGNDTRLSEKLPDFPRGLACDQIILR